MRIFFVLAIYMGKIAFCFLVYDKIVRHDIWNKFFKNCNREEYDVIIHSKFSFGIQYLNEIYKFKYREIGRDDAVNTISKTHISIVQATLLLFKKALEDQQISHIVFLSQSCIPLHSYHKLFGLINRTERSMIDYKLNNSLERHAALERSLQNRISKQFFLKQQPNMILIRRDAEMYVNKSMIGEWSRVICADEHYFINNAIHIFKMDILKVQINFCNINLNRTQALTFNNVTINFTNQLRERGFLFMRKIDKNSKIDLSYLD